MTTLVLDRASTELPFPVVRWLEVAWSHGAEVLDSITMAGPLRLRRSRLRMPGDATIRFLLGAAYVSDLRIGLGPLTAIRGLDAFVGGTGMTRIGNRVDMGTEIDQGAFLALWAQSILFPDAWSRLDGLRWMPVDETRTRVALPFAGGEEVVTLLFDADETPFPIAFEADRYKVIGGPKVGWRVDYAEWHWRDGIAVPTRTVVTWADEAAPWFDMRMETVVPNDPLEAHVERAREAMAAARAEGATAGR